MWYTTQTVCVATIYHHYVCKHMATCMQECLVIRLLEERLSLDIVILVRINVLGRTGD